MTRTLAILTLAALTLAACGGGNPDNSPPEMSPAMRAALKNDDVRALRKLLDAGESPDALDLESEWCAVRIAASKPAGSCLELLIERHADLNQRYGDGTTALITAVVTGHTGNVLRLLNAGADEHADPNGWTPLAAAAFDGKRDVAEALLDRGADPLEPAGSLGTALHAAAGGLSDKDGEKSPDIVRLLLAHVPRDADIDVPDKQGYSPLAKAVFAGGIERVRALLAAGAKPNFSVAKFGTVLHVAAIHGDVEKIEALLEAGADIEARDANGATPVLKAVKWGRSGSLEALLKAGADANAQDDDGNTALHISAREPSFSKSDRDTRAKWVALLIRHGADPSLRNKEGKTPEDLCEWFEIKHALHGE